MNPLHHNPVRQEALRSALLSSVDCLYRRRAADIPEGYIEDYVALHWMEWNAGGLQLTTTGHNICRQLKKQVA